MIDASSFLEVRLSNPSDYQHRDAPLYLEWAPGNILTQCSTSKIDEKNNAVGEHDAKRFILEQQEGLMDMDIDPDRVEVWYSFLSCPFNLFHQCRILPVLQSLNMLQLFIFFAKLTSKSMLYLLFPSSIPSNRSNNYLLIKYAVVNINCCRFLGQWSFVLSS